MTASALLTWDEDGNPETPNNIFSQPIDSKWGEYNTLAHAWTESHEDFYLSRTELVEDGEAADLGLRLAWLLVDGGANNKFLDAAFDAWGHYTNGYAYYDHDDAKTAEVEKDYTQCDRIVESLNLTDNMRVALECRMAGMSYPEIGRILERAQATVYEYFIKMRQRYIAIYG